MPNASYIQIDYSRYSNPNPVRATHRIPVKPEVQPSQMVQPSGALQSSMNHEWTIGANSGQHHQVHTLASQVHAQHPSTSTTLPLNIATHIFNLSNENRRVIAELNAFKSSSEARERAQQAQIKVLSIQYKELDQKHRELGASWAEHHEANTAYRRVKVEDMALIERLNEELDTSKAKVEAHRTAVSEWQRKEDHLKCVCLEAVAQLKAWMDKAGRLAKHVAAKDREMDLMKAIEKGYFRKIKALKAQIAQVTATSVQIIVPTGEPRSPVVQRPLTALDWLQERADMQRASQPVVIDSSIGNISALPGSSHRQTQVPMHLPPHPLDMVKNVETSIGSPTLDPLLTRESTDATNGFARGEESQFEAGTDAVGGPSDRKRMKISGTLVAVDLGSDTVPLDVGKASSPTKSVRMRSENKMKRRGKKTQDAKSNYNSAVSSVCVRSMGNHSPGFRSRMVDEELDEEGAGADGFAFEFELEAEVKEGADQMIPLPAARINETSIQLADSASTLNMDVDDAVTQPNSVDDDGEGGNQERAVLAIVFDVKDEDEKRGVLQCRLCLQTFKKEKLFTVIFADEKPLVALVDHCKTMHEAEYARALELHSARVSITPNHAES
ncbi:hypothetical protein FRB95_013343 [Tulasnella sp. JGI-2019a]|nr:hypothetical protein FRB93_001421 [Tulasnella sp. JGI-2019a]KAG9023251.1 hypothetical protein FRB95_013343 [Tulasnella sp. JGI-2019a]